MEHRRLGHSGLPVSEIGLGTVLLGKHVDATAAHQIVDAAMDAGITFIDTSDSYADGESERLLGTILGARRRDVAVDQAAVVVVLVPGMVAAGVVAAGRVAAGVVAAFDSRTGRVELAHSSRPSTVSATWAAASSTRPRRWSSTRR